MEEKYIQFLSFDWEHSTEWRNYYNNIFPQPPPERLDYYKKKFYKLKVDRDFDVNYIPSNIRNENNRNTNQNNHSGNNSNITQQDVVFYIKNSLAILSFSIGLLYSFDIAVKIFILGIILQIYYEKGFPTYDREYLISLIANENLSDLIYAGLLIFFKVSNTIFAFPLLFRIMLNITEIANQYINNIQIINYILTNQRKLYFYKNIIEIILLPLTLIGFIIGVNQLFYIIIYVQFMRFKWFALESTKSSFMYINSKLERLEGPNGERKFIIETVQKCASFLSQSTTNPLPIMGMIMCSIY